jgi:hypothetical protein
MKGPLVGLCRMQGNTSFAPLAALGYYLRQQDFFAPIRHEVKLKMKTVKHEPHEKLIDCLVSILVGCRNLGQSNLRLRPDEVLAAAWGGVLVKRGQLTRPPFGMLQTFGTSRVPGPLPIAETPRCPQAQSLALGMCQS